nr:NADH dehydrogenase subunit 3 [Acanalonia sp.]
MKIMYVMSTTMMITIMVFTLTTMISKKTKMSREKNTPFECGFSPINSARKPFSNHFFLIATMFLIFDIEISIMLPMSFSKFSQPNEWMISSIMTILILLMGLYHEWNNGMLEWTK